MTSRLAYEDKIKLLKYFNKHGNKKIIPTKITQSQNQILKKKKQRNYMIQFDKQNMCKN